MRKHGGHGEDHRGHGSLYLDLPCAPFVSVFSVLELLLYASRRPDMLKPNRRQEIPNTRSDNRTRTLDQ